MTETVKGKEDGQDHAKRIVIVARGNVRRGNVTETGVTEIEIVVKDWSILKLTMVERSESKKNPSMVCSIILFGFIILLIISLCIFSNVTRIFNLINIWISEIFMWLKHSVSYGSKHTLPNKFLTNSLRNT